MIKTYYRLTKPGIIYGNLLTAAGGFLLASKTNINFPLFLATLAGTSLVIASACVVNNYIDRNIDKKMKRTRKRALASGKISGRNALIYASILGFIGVAILVSFTNLLTASIGLIAFFVYVVLYGIAKRQSVHGTLVGSVAGAAPIVAGYCAVTNHFGVEAALLFMILAVWQMPHFYAIAIYRFDDYAAAGLPVLPVVKGVENTRRQILRYIVAFIIAVSLLTILGYTGYTFLIVMTLFGVSWLYRGVGGYQSLDPKLWARRMFLFSLVVILALSVMVSVGARLP